MNGHHEMKNYQRCALNVRVRIGIYQERKNKVFLCVNVEYVAKEI